VATVKMGELTVAEFQQLCMRMESVGLEIGENFEFGVYHKLSPDVKIRELIRAMIASHFRDVLTQAEPFIRAGFEIENDFTDASAMVLNSFIDGFVAGYSSGNIEVEKEISDYVDNMGWVDIYPPNPEKLTSKPMSLN